MAAYNALICAKAFSYGNGFLDIWEPVSVFTTQYSFVTRSCLSLYGI
jgi:hypothetical protein